MVQQSDCTGGIDQFISAYESALNQFISSRIEFYTQELQHFATDQYASTGNNGILGGLKDALRFNIGPMSFDFSGLVDQQLQKILGFDLNGNMFNNLFGSFQGLGVVLLAMFYTDRNTTWKFIDYSKVAFVNRLNTSILSINRLNEALELFHERYSLLTESEIQEWQANYISYIERTKENLEEAEDQLSLLEVSMVRSGVISDHHKDSAIAYLNEALFQLEGEGLSAKVFELANLKLEIDDALNQFMSMAGQIRKAHKNHQTMPEQITGTPIGSVYGVDMIKNSKSAVSGMISQLDSIIEEVGSDIYVSVRTNSWKAQIESIKAIINMVGEDNEPDLTSDHYQRAVEFADYLKLITLDEIDEIEQDTKALLKYLDKIFKEGRVIKIDNLYTRLQSNLQDVGGKFISIRDTIKSQIPDRLDPKIGSFAQQLRAASFDAWLDLLITGDWKSFLLITFGQSTSSGALIHSILNMLECDLTAASVPDIMFMFQHAKLEQMQAEHALKLESLSPIRSLYRKNLTFQRRQINVKGQRATRGLRRLSQLQLGR